MDEKQRAALAAELASKTPEELAEIDRAARATLTQLEDLNSSFPATREFLESRGLTNVRQLDKSGLQELKEHLERTLQGLCKAKA